MPILQIICFFLSVTSVPLWEMAKKYLIEIRWQVKESGVVGYCIE